MNTRRRGKKARRLLNRSLLPAALALLVFIGASATPAQQRHSSAQRWQRALSLGRSSGGGDSEVVADDMRFGLVRRVSPSLSLVGEGQIIRFRGIQSGLRNDTTGVGVAASFRWHLWESQRWGVSFEQGVGWLQSGDPFPAGGTRGNFTLHAEFGFRSRLRPGVALRGGLRYLHLSNGRGLVPENPSYNGAGGYLGLVFGDAPPRRREAATVEKPTDSPRRGFASAEVYSGEADDERLSGLWLVAGTRLSRRWTAQAEAGLGRLAGLTARQGGLSLSWASGPSAVTASVLRSELDRLDGWAYSLQWERDFSRRASLVAAGSVRTPSFGPDHRAAALAVSAAVFPSLTILTGVQWEGTSEESVDASGLGVLAGVEWSPRALERAGVSFFAEDRLDGVSVAGVRITPGGRRVGSLHYRRSRIRRLR